MRRSRLRKKLIGIRQAGVWNAGAPSVPSYESFTIPTPGGFPSEGIPGDNMDMNLTGRKRPASDAERFKESASSKALLQPLLVERDDDGDGAFACHHSLGGGLGSARPVQQASNTGVKQIIVKLSGLRQSTASSGEVLSVNHGETVKDMRMEAESQHETHRAMWSNDTDCTENRQEDHIVHCKYPDLQSSTQNVTVTPTVRNQHQALQIPGVREPKEPVEALKEDRPSSATCGNDSGGSMRSLAPIDESCCVPESSNGQVRSGYGHDLSAPSAGCFHHPANSSWMSTNANVCRSCPATLSKNNQAVTGCNACVSSRFTPPYTFQRGVPRAVRYYVEPASPNQMKCFPSRIEQPACCQRLNLEEAQPPGLYAQTMKQGGDLHPQTVRGRNLVTSSRTGEGHTCGAHYISGDDVLVCPAPWVHKGRTFPGIPAMCKDHQKYESMGVNWAPETQSDGQPSQNEKSEENAGREMPEPILPPAHSNNHTNFSPDLDMDTQRQLEEQIAHEILLLSQKLANLQARYGARGPVHDNTKPAILSCPETPLLLDNSRASQRDHVKCSTQAPVVSQGMRNEETTQPRPITSSSSRSTHRESDPRCQLEERKLGGRNIGTNRGPSSNTNVQCLNRGSDLWTTTVAVNANKNHPNSRALSGSHTSGNSTTGSRATTIHSGCQHGASEATPVQGWGKVFRESVEAEKSSKKSRAFSSPYRKGRERPTEEIADECSYSDDMKEHVRNGGAHVQGYPNGNKRFDWVKTLRFGGVVVRDNQGCPDFASNLNSKSSSLDKEFAEIDAETWLRDSSEQELFARDLILPTSMSKSVQAGGISPEERIGTCTGTPTDLDDRRGTESRSKRMPDSTIEYRPGKTGKRAESPDEMGGLDSRLAHHLVKAGLRRAPSFWRVPGIRPVPNTPKMKKKIFGSRSPRKDGGKRLRRKSLFEFNPKSNPPNVLPEVHLGERKVSDGQSCELKDDQTKDCDDALDAQWKKEFGDYEAEYETFVENTEVGLHDTLDSEGYTSVVNREAPTSIHSEEEEQKRSPSSIPAQRNIRLSKPEVPVVSLTKAPQAMKNTFIRCIELVVATKKKTQFSKLNGRKGSGIGYSLRRVDCLERPSKDGYGMEKDCNSRTFVSEGKHGTMKSNGHS